MKTIQMKKCNHCNEIKPETEFYFRYKKLGIRASTCKKCKADFDRRYYRSRSKEHKQTVKKQRAARKEVAQKFIIDYLSTHPCVDCGEADIRILEFDHVRGEKKMAIAQMIGSGYSVKAMQKEIGHCEVRCGHCHKIKTSKERGWFRR